MKVILTGGCRGIGRAALEIFAAEGCDVAFFSRHGGKVIGKTFDMNDADGYAAWLTRRVDALGAATSSCPAPVRRAPS